MSWIARLGGVLIAYGTFAIYEGFTGDSGHESFWFITGVLAEVGGIPMFTLGRRDGGDAW